MMTQPNSPRPSFNAGPSCANVSRQFVRAPENDLSLARNATIEVSGDRAIKDRFSDAYAGICNLKHLIKTIFYVIILHDFSMRNLAVE